MDSQRGENRIWRGSTLGACLGLVELDHRFPMHNLLHFPQKSLASGALLGRGLLVITVGEALRAELTELLGAHELSAHLRLHEYFARIARVFQSLPKDQGPLDRRILT